MAVKFSVVMVDGAVFTFDRKCEDPFNYIAVGIMANEFYEFAVYKTVIVTKNISHISYEEV